MAMVAIHHIGVPRRANIRTCIMASKHPENVFLPRYVSSITDAESKQHYIDRIQVIGWDPYELPRREWKDDVDLRPAITYVHICMYLTLNPSLYTKDDMLSYRSLDSFKSFLDEWVREVLLREKNHISVVIGKVSL